MILFSDLHLRDDSAETVLKEVLPGIREACLASRDLEVGFLGDWYHIRYTISVRLMNAVRDELLRWHEDGIRVYMIPGNHDQIDIHGRNALEVLGDLPNVEVYTVPTWNHHGLWMPYRASNDVLKAELAQAIACQATMPYAGQPLTLFIHHGVRGALMNDTKANTEGLGVEAFAGFNAILCGHYHKRQTLDRLTYIGSPWQTTAAEAGQPKGCAHWDGTRLQFTDMAWGPRFFNVAHTGGKFVMPKGATERDEVRVKTTGATAEADAKKIGKALAKAGIPGVVTPEVQAAEQRLDVSQGESLEGYAKAYVDQLPTELGRERLMAAFKYVTGA